MFKRNGLSLQERVLYIYLFSCPHRNILGFYKLPTPYISEDLSLSVPAVKKLLAGLEKRGLIKYDHSAGVVLVRKFLSATRSRTGMLRRRP